MNLSKINGLKFPDEQITRFFFKNNFHKKTGKVLELGCGNGSNLNLFSHYGWETVGVDNNKKSISIANINFKKFNFKNYNFINRDMYEFLTETNFINFDVILFPNSIYYLSFTKINSILEKINKKKLMKKRFYFFFVFRLDNDFRKKISSKVSKNTYKINKNITGEYGLNICLLKKKDIVNLLNINLNIIHIYLLLHKYDNVQNNFIVNNSDLVVWGSSNVKN